MIILDSSYIQKSVIIQSHKQIAKKTSHILKAMDMTLNLAPNKHMLDLNFDEDSSGQDPIHSSTNQQKSKFQKVYDLDADFLKRDKFTSKQVQKGLFFSESDTLQYDTFQVKQKTSNNNIGKDTLPKIQKANQKNLTENKIDSMPTKKTSTKLHQNILSLKFQEKSSSEQDQISIDESQMQSASAEKKLQSQTVLQSKKKILDINFSQSSSGQQDQQQKQSNPSFRSKELSRKKPIIQKKQKRQQQKDEKQSEEEEQQESKEELEEESEEGQDEEENQKSEEKQARTQEKQQSPPPLKDFQFTKQPQQQVLDQIRPQQRVRAIVARSREGLNLLWPEYQILIQSDKQEILYVKKQAKLLKGQYKIYNRNRNGQSRYFGRLMANMSGTQYQIFISQNGVHENLKAEMYFPNDSKSNQPRYFIMISLIDGFNISDLVVTDPSSISLKQLYKNELNKSKMMILHTRKPIYHEQIRGFVLNFNGRVNMPSIKNFILEDAATHKEVLMFGKIDKENFRLQISSPLNCVMGTAVALIQFQGRFME